MFMIQVGAIWASAVDLWTSTAPVASAVRGIRTGEFVCHALRRPCCRRRPDSETHDLFEPAGREISESLEDPALYDPEPLKRVETRCHDVWLEMIKKDLQVP